MVFLQAIPLIRAFLGFILLLSGVGKLLDPTGTRRAVDQYGVSLRWRWGAARLFPLLELAIGAALVLHLVPLLFSSAALVTFSIFLVGVGRVLSRGTTMDCHCFGALTRERVGTATVVRLVLFILMTCAVVGADLLTLKAHGFALVASGIESAEMLIPIAAAGSIGAVGLLVLRQLVITLRAARHAE